MLNASLALCHLMLLSPPWSRHCYSLSGNLPSGDAASEKNQNRIQVHLSLILSSSPVDDTTTHFSLWQPRETGSLCSLVWVQDSGEIRNGEGGLPSWDRGFPQPFCLCFFLSPVSEMAYLSPFHCHLFIASNQGFSLCSWNRLLSHAPTLLSLKSA